MTGPLAIRLLFRRAAAAKISLGCASLLGVFALGWPGALAQGLSATPSLSQSWLFDEKGGAALYGRVCAACHQPDARGAVGAAAYPALAANQNLASAEYMEGVLFNGLRGMPALGRMMNDEQVADVINYVRSHFGNNYDDAVAAADVHAQRPK